jgi:hypothetical protein
MPKYLIKFLYPKWLADKFFKIDYIITISAKTEKTCGGLTWLEGFKTQFFDCGAKAAA